MRKLLFATLGLGLVTLNAIGDQTTETILTSPDQHISVHFHLDPDGAPRYSVSLNDHEVLQDSRLGLLRADADFTRELSLKGTTNVETVHDSYEILTTKRRLNTYEANKQVFHLTNPDGKELDITFQVSNDGVAFRYTFPETSPDKHYINEELSSFHLPSETKAWLQPMSVAKTGWARTNPSYEEYYQKGIPVGTPSTLGAGWVFPALFNTGDTWLLISESSLSHGYCASRLRDQSPNGEYSIGFPDHRENFNGRGVNPVSTLPWTTPWRLIVIGSLKTIAESTLGTDLADPAKYPTPELQPGKASWSWPLLGDGQTKFDVQKRFIDYAADMHWNYCLIDAQWDTQIGYDKIKELADYAATRNVKILVWYNSNGTWNDAPQTPRHMLLTHEKRIAEFTRLKEMGIAGLKIDFFGGDGSSMIDYYLDILQDAQPFGFLVNFHGCTLPRGWERTYPNLMTMEAIRGQEFITFEQANADQEPTHCAMLPFTRNVFDPMDFTPVVLDHMQRVQRRTTSAFELALSVLFTSGITHYAEIPEGMGKAPDYVQDFLRHVPAIWDDVRFLAGYPGQYVVLARRSGNKWYLAGINAEDEPRSLSLDLNELGLSGKTGRFITEETEANLSFQQTNHTVKDNGQINVSLRPHGGFVAVFE